MEEVNEQSNQKVNQSIRKHINKATPSNPKKSTSLEESRYKYNLLIPFSINSISHYLSQKYKPQKQTQRYIERSTQSNTQYQSN